MSDAQNPNKKVPAAELPEQLTAEAELLEENFDSADTLEDFTKILMDSMTSKLQANIEDIFKQLK